METAILGRQWPPSLLGTRRWAVVVGDGMELLVVPGVWGQATGQEEQ